MRSRLPAFRLGRRTTGLVLSGAGSKASFQLGALRYLYDVVGIQPSVITGTSAGAILAAALAQHADLEGQRRARRAVERVWLGLRESSDMYTELPWFSTLRTVGPTWMRAFRARQRTEGPAPRPLLPAAFTLRRAEPANHARVATEAAETPDGEASDGEASDGERVGTTAWSPLTVLEWISLLRDLSRTGGDVEEVLRGAGSEQAVYRPGPVVEQLLDPDVFDPERVSTSGVRLRIAVVGLESGELHYVTETGRLVDRQDRPLPDREPVGLVEAIRASCAIPAVFAPVALSGEHYVDGGTRESLPAQVAVEHLGVTDCYAVVATAPGPAREPSFAERNMFSIMMRATTGVMSAEIERNEVDWAQSAGATVIQPELDVHDGMTVEPALLAVAADYGYLRAAQVVTRASAAEQQLGRDLVRLRKEIWELERTLAARPGAPATASDLAERRAELRRVVADLPAEHLPPGAERWGGAADVPGEDAPATPPA